MQSESVGLWILRLAWAGECMDFVQKLRRPAQALENGVGLLKMCFFVGTVSPGMPPSFPTPRPGKTGACVTYVHFVLAGWPQQKLFMVKGVSLQEPSRMES